VQYSFANAILRHLYVQIKIAASFSYMLLLLLWKTDLPVGLGVKKKNLVIVAYAMGKQ